MKIRPVKKNVRLSKKLQSEVERLRQQHPEKTVELWAEDEGRLGLKPITRRQWSRRGKRPIAIQKRGYEWLHSFCFVHPQSGSSEFWIMSHADTITTQVVLDEFSKAVNADGSKIIVLLWDNASWHSSAALKVPEGMILHPLPAYTPELSPAEPLMPLLRECLANRLISKLCEVEDLLVKRCLYLQANPEVVKGACGFSWACL
jgi:hypothetical protein